MKKSIQEIKEKLNKINDNIEILEETYLGSHSYHLVKCKTCGYEWKTSPLVLMRGAQKNGCPKCTGRIPYTIELIKEKLSIANPDLELLSKQYNHKKHLEVKCKKCGNIFKSKKQKLLNGARCQKCSSRVTKNHNQYMYGLQKRNPNISNKFELIGQYVNYSVPLTVKCKSCGYTWIASLTTINQLKSCPHCEVYGSSYELKIIKWLESIGIKNIIHNKRFSNKYEIDIFLHDFNLGIEFHGIFYHSDRYVNRSYHQQKYKYFKNLEIQLIQIFENEWVNNEEIVKSIIMNKIGKNLHTIYARNCEIKEISNDIYRTFCENNHIQGYANASIKYGLFHSDINDFVCIIGFGKARFSKNTYEIIRFANKLYYNVVGGFSRLLKYFERNTKIKNLISFVDPRYFSGKSYEQNGFAFELLTKPNYYYFKQNTFTLYHRANFQKHKLVKKLPLFDSLKSEYQNMCDNHYLRIFDAGHLRFKKT